GAVERLGRGEVGEALPELAGALGRGDEAAGGAARRVGERRSDRVPAPEPVRRRGGGRAPRRPERAAIGGRRPAFRRGGDGGFGAVAPGLAGRRGPRPPALFRLVASRMPGHYKTPSDFGGPFGPPFPKRVLGSLPPSAMGPRAQPGRGPEGADRIGLWR